MQRNPIPCLVRTAALLSTMLLGFILAVQLIVVPFWYMAFTELGAFPYLLVFSANVVFVVLSISMLVGTKISTSPARYFGRAIWGLSMIAAGPLVMYFLNALGSHFYDFGYLSFGSLYYGLAISVAWVSFTLFRYLRGKLGRIIHFFCLVFPIYALPKLVVSTFSLPQGTNFLDYLSHSEFLVALVFMFVVGMIRFIKD